MARLFGRRPEIGAVTRHLADDRAVVVTGEAGIGKTALLDAVADVSGRRVWRGGGLSMLADVPYLALERAVGRRLEGDPASVVRSIADQVGDGVLLIDDLQWIDPFGLATVERLTDRIALLGAVRLGERPSERVLASLKFAGSAVVELSPLDDETSGQLIAGVRPDASALERDRIARLAGHNPLLMTELAQTGETESLRRAVRARLHPVSDTGRDWLRAIAIVGRPVDRDELGESADELEAAHLLVTSGSGRVEIRHDLLAEVVRGDMADDVRADTHRRVARLVDDHHEAARHHFLGGEHELAHGRARAAVRGAPDGSARRAAALQVMALTASGADADQLRLSAARISIQHRLLEPEIAELLDSVEGHQPEVLAEVESLRAWYEFLRGDTACMRAAIARGLGLVAGTGTPAEARLLVLEARVGVAVDGYRPETMPRARAALDAARRIGAHIAFAESVVACASYLAGAAEWRDQLADAIEHARDEGDLDVEFTAAQNMISFLESTGHQDQAAELADDYATRARTTDALNWDSQFREQRHNLDFHRGNYASVIDGGYALLGEGLDHRSEERCAQVMVGALIDMARFDEARELLGDWMVRSSDDKQGRWWFEYFSADIELFAGRPRRAIELADRVLAWPELEAMQTCWPIITRGWACLDLGVPLLDVVADSGGLPIVDGVGPESEGQHALAGGDDEHAADRFAAAIGLWTGQHFRGEMRSRWGRGEALRRAGRHDDALSELLDAERLAEARGAEAVLRRIRRSLRLLGERRAAVRTRSASGLTAREHQIVDLVGRGLTNIQIARRLGVSRSTIAAQVSSAMLKVGAESRAHLVESMSSST